MALLPDFTQNRFPGQNGKSSHGFVAIAARLLHELAQKTVAFQVCLPLTAAKFYKFDDNGIYSRRKSPIMSRIYSLLVALVMAPLLATVGLAQDTYRIKAGDVLRVEVLEDTSLNREALVRPDGRISFPLAGSVSASGRTVEQVQANLTTRLEPNFASAPTVFVTVSRLAEVKEPTERKPVVSSVYVIGEVGKPGRLDVERGTTLLQLFAQAGGFSKFAATKRIQLRRTDKSGVEKVYKINYEDIVSGKTNQGTTVVADGDVLIVPQRKLFE